MINVNCLQNVNILVEPCAQPFSALIWILKLIVEKLRLKHIRDGALIRRNNPEAVVLWLREIVNPKKYRLGWQKQVSLIFSENSG